VSYWDVDGGTGVPFEAFPAPNICLPWYDFSHPYYFLPGNVNFSPETVFPGPPYNLYNFHCGGPLQLVRRGLLSYDTSGGVVLPVRFANVRAEISAEDRVTISWSNMTESEIQNYTVESSVDGVLFQPTGTVLPTGNNGERADYTYSTSQTAATGYYRIKATEITGNVLYSTILVVRRTIPVVLSDQSFSTYPNPVTAGEFTIRLANAPAGRYICSVINSEGNPVRQKMIQHNSGDLVRQIDMSVMPSGIYQVLLRSSDKKFTQRIVYVN
ncbi:MAG TPA: T9SS type A sorting domain-containing protein, partial [Chitinophagaceae bacterium]|nr:T9SS type A sorting domain-containing protein [Chitinophagaceae bacterium]